MEVNLETIIKNASRRIKITQSQLVRNQYWKPKILIYENGYIVGMYCSSASPQFIHRSEKIYGKELGEHIVNCTLPHQVYNDTVENIVEMVKLEMSF